MNSYFDGSMLGDGTLEPYKDVSARLQIRRQLKHAEYNEWLMRMIPISWLEPTTLTSKSLWDGRLIQGEQHNVRSRRQKALAVERKRWYGSGKKDPPSDLVLAPETLAVWHMDDGSLSFTRTGTVHLPIIAASVQLHANGFSLEGCQFLSELLRSTFGLKSSVGRSRKVIAISGRSQASHFIEIVTPVIQQVSCMAYKIDLSRMTPLTVPRKDGPNRDPETGQWLRKTG